MAQVIARYGFNAPLTWSEELSRYLFIWLSFLAGWLAWRRREHLGVEALAAALPNAAADLLRRVVEVLVVLFAAAAMYYGQRILRVSANQPSAVLRIPMAWVYLAFYAGMTLVILETVIGWLARLAGQEAEPPQ
jgi:TRAP-type transport system small permease protein